MSLFFFFFLHKSLDVSSDFDNIITGIKEENIL